MSESDGSECDEAQRTTGCFEIEAGGAYEVDTLQRIEWEFDPPKPKELTPAILGPEEEGQSVGEVTTSILSNRILGLGELK